MSETKKYSSQTSRIGKMIYPVRIIGYTLACAAVFLSRDYFGHEQFSAQVIVFLCFIFVYPHAAYLFYLRSGSRRNNEFRILIFDMFLIGWISSLLHYSPVTAVPFVVANSATNYSLNGRKLFLKGFLAHLAGCLFFGIFNNFRIEFTYEIEMAVPSLIYFFLGAHYIGYLSFNRGLKIKKSKDQIVEQNKIIENNSRAMHAGLTYARRIQQAVLPVKENIDAVFPENFVLFRPRDVVSGDFYWFGQIGEKHILSVADCTGHGVPGAFMSMLGSQALSEIIGRLQIGAPDQILTELDKTVRKSLKQEQTGNRDGMDIVVLTVDKSQKKAVFAGAKNPLIYFQNGEMTMIKGSKSAIGDKKFGAGNRQYPAHEITLGQPTLFYLYSDGFQDQFGGPNNKKFMVKRFRNLLSEIHVLPLNEQKPALEKTLDSWISEAGESQTDDICLWACRIDCTENEPAAG